MLYARILVLNYCKENPNIDLDKNVIPRIRPMNENGLAKEVNTADSHHASERHLLFKNQFTSINLDTVDRLVDQHWTELQGTILNSRINMQCADSVTCCRA